LETTYQEEAVWKGIGCCYLDAIKFNISLNRATSLASLKRLDESLEWFAKAEALTPVINKRAYEVVIILKTQVLDSCKRFAESRELRSRLLASNKTLWNDP